MNNEIKEIDRIIINVKRNLQFSPERRFVELFNKDEIKHLLDYITNLQQQLHQASLDIQELTEKDIECPSWCDKLTNLQQEINKLTAESTEWESKCYELQQENERIEKDYKSKVDDIGKLTSRIYKAIEYIKEHYPTSTINYQDDKYILLSILLNGSEE